MDRKHLERKHCRTKFFLCFSLLICLSIVSCSGFKDRGKKEGPQAHLVRAQELLLRHDYEASLRENKLALAASGNKPPADKALFNLGVIYYHPGNPRRDPDQAAALFKRLQKDFPRSLWADEASAWMDTFKEMERLRRASVEASQENEKLRRASSEVAQENERLKRAAAETQLEIQRLKRIVEQSRIVDIEIDEKQRSHAK